MFNVNILIDEYNNKVNSHLDFCDHLKVLVEEIIKEKSIKINSITSRVKELESFKNKIMNTEGKYQILSDVTDIVGLRIITYFEDEVDNIAKIIEDEFQIDPNNSIDKRKLLDPDRFGYLSLHYVVEMHPKRLNLHEYKRFAGYKAEIQIRSILQHTWAEIEHDLGYKSIDTIPREIRRSFSRLAGLLELADCEFSRIRDTLENYEQKIQQQFIIESLEIPIDKSSLKIFIDNSLIINKIEEEMADLLSIKIDLEYSDAAIDSYVKRLNYFGFNNIGEIEASLIEYRKEIIKFATLWINNSDKDILPKGICLFYLAYVLVTKQDHERVREYLKKMRIIPREGYTIDSLVNSLMETWDQVSAALD